MSHDDSAATSIDLTIVSDIVSEDAEGKSDSIRVTLIGVGGGGNSPQNKYMMMKVKMERVEIYQWQEVKKLKLFNFVQ